MQYYRLSIFLQAQVCKVWCNDKGQPCRYYSLWVQETLTALKRVYYVERSLYLYSAEKFLSYLMWNVTNTLLVVSHAWDYKVKRTNTPYKAKQNGPPHQGRGSTLISFVTNQPNLIDIIHSGLKKPSRL